MDTVYFAVTSPHPFPLCKSHGLHSLPKNYEASIHVTVMEMTTPIMLSKCETQMRTLLSLRKSTLNPDIQN